MNTKQVEKDTEFTSDTKETHTNTTFADQRSSAETLGQQANLPPSPKYIPDMEWRAAQQLMKPIVVSTLPWSVTDANGYVLSTISLPDMYVGESAVDSIHTETLKMYSLMRGNPVFRFQLNGTKFHLGQVIAAWQPLRTKERDIGSVFTMTGYPHVQLSASGNDPVELKIPFVHPQNYLTTNALNVVSLGTLQVQVLNQLRAADASSSTLNITITLHWEDAEVHVPIYRHDIVGIEPDSVEVEATGLFDVVNDITNNVTATVSHMTTGNFGGLMKDATNLVNKATSAMSSFGGLLDKPNYITNPQKTISPISSLANGKGTDTSFRLGLDPGAVPVKNALDFGDTTDEMDMNHIISTPMMVGRANWVATQAAGTKLFHFPVTPTLNATVGPLYANTFLSYMANLFQYWKGGIRYRFDFVSTSFHTGRLLVAFIPNSWTTSGPTLNQAMSCPYTIIDVQKTSRVTIEVPFISPTPVKTNSVASSVANVTGWVYVYVLNELVMPNNVANNIDINIYTSAAPDFNFYVPTRNFMRYNSPIPDEFDGPIQPVGLFANIQEGNYAVDDNPIILGTGGIERYQKDFGETYSLFDYIKRYSLDSRGVTSITPVPFTNSIRFGGTPEDKTAGPLCAVAQLFACWTGSLRYKFLYEASRDSPNTTTIYGSPNDLVAEIYNSTDFTGLPALATNTSQDCALEFEIPPYTPYNFALVDSYSTETFNIEMGGVTLVDTVAEIKYTSYFAAGDDFQAFYMVAPPAVFAGKSNVIVYS